MKEIENKKIRITKLDIYILVFVSEMKFVNAEQIGEKFFEGKGLRYPKKRLKDFVDNDLLFSVLEWGGKKLNYLITENGTKLVQRKGFDVVPFGMKGIDLKNHDHDKLLTSIRIKLEKKKIVDSWTSERIIRNRNLYLRVNDKDKIIPDAYCRSVDKDSDLIIEFENSRKSNDRIKKLLKNYQFYFAISKNINEKVLFFFVSDALLSSYKQIYADSKFTFPIQFIAIKDLGLEQNLQEYRRI